MMRVSFVLRANAFRAAGMLALALVLSGRLNAQGSTSASILGTVTDPSGAVVAGAPIQVRNVATGQTQQSPTNAEGRYTVADLPIGTYEAQAVASGFQTTVRRGITLAVGSQTVVDFSLVVGQTQQTVAVEGAVSQVDTVSATVSANVEQKQINDLPLNGRNFTDLVALAPGVASGQQIGGGAAPNNLYGKQANFSVSGARAEGQAYLLDNTDIQDFWQHGAGSGVMGTTLGVEAIAEFSLLTNTYSAQFGGNGAVVNAASKSGTNGFHGSAYEYLRNSALDARNFFDTTKPPFRQNQFGGSLGGPIQKDKAFFFVNDEELRNVLGQTVIALVPDADAHQGIVKGVNVGVNPAIAPILAAMPIPTNSTNGVGSIPEQASQTGNENYLLARVDYTFSSKDSAFLRYVRDAANITQPFLGSPLPPRWPEVGTTGNHFVTIEERHIFSPTLINLFRFSFTRTAETDALTSNNPLPVLNFLPYTGQNGIVNITGLSSFGPSIYPPIIEVQNKFPVADDVFWNRGSHSIRFGGSVTREQLNFAQDGWYGGSYTFSSVTNFLLGNANSFLGPEPGQTDPYRDFREVQASGYIHDEWRAFRNLTLNLGVRYEFVSNPTTNVHPLNTVTNPPFGTFTRVPHVFASNPSLHNIDPRVGIAYDPFSDHKTSIRAGFGIFHNPIEPRTYASGYYFNPPYALANILFPSFPNPFPGALPSPAQIVGVDYNVCCTPRMLQWNFNVQRQLFESTTLTVGYVGSRGIHLYAARDVNPVLPTVVNGVQVFGTPRGATTSGIASNPRLNPAASALSSEAPVGDSSYNSLQVGLNRRFSKGLQTQGSYTWSKCMDDASGTYGLEGGIPWSAPLNGSFDRGRCVFDRTQAFKLSGLYAFPFKANRLVSGWETGAVLTAQTGSPWNVIIGFDQSGSFVGNQRPNVVMPADKIINGSVTAYANPGAFVLPAPGTLGNLQRDLLTGPGTLNLDYSLIKDTQVKENLRIQFRAEFFNILNHANFSLPNANAFVQGVNGGGSPNPTFGKITSTTTPGRQIQFALKILF
jgi:hypothetical protein